MSIEERTDPGNKSAAELEREVEAQRAEVEHTLDSLQERLSPGQMMDQFFDYAKNGNGAEFTRNLGRSMRDNPLPIALMGVGVAWLMLGNNEPPKRRYRADERYLDDGDDDDWDDRFSDDEYDVTGRPVSFGTTPEGARASSPIGYGGADQEKSLTEKAGDVADDVKHTVGDAAARANHALHDTGEAASRYGRDLKRRAHRYGDRASQTAGRYGQKARRSFLDTLEEQPLVLGAIGVAIGAALGASLPSTEREDELMGETRDQLKHQAKDAAREQADKARDMANAAYGAAKDEAGSTMDTVKDKAAKVADAAKTAAQREAPKS